MEDEIRLSDGTTLSQKDFEKLGRLYNRTAKVVRNKRPDMQMNIPAGENAKCILDSLEIYKLPEIDKHDAEQVKNRITEYFEICARQDSKPNVPGLALALGFDRTTISRVAYGKDGFDKTYSAEVRGVVKRAYEAMNLHMEQLMENGKINPVVGIFLSKNHWGYQDKNEVVVSSAAPEENYSADDIRKRYLKDPRIVEVPESDISD